MATKKKEETSTAPATKISTLKISEIRTDGGFYCRAGGPPPETVAEYADLMQEGAKFPPVVVFLDQDGVYWLADGYIRVESAKKDSREEIDAEIHQGDKRAARLYAAGANADHGLRRTAKDKRQAVANLLADPEWFEWSVNKLAEAAKVSHHVANEVKAEYLSTSKDAGQQVEAPAKVKTVRGGKPHTVTTGNIGKNGKKGTATPSQDAAAIQAQPWLSLNKDGRAVGGAESGIAAKQQLGRDHKVVKNLNHPAHKQEVVHTPTPAHEPVKSEEKKQEETTLAPAPKIEEGRQTAEWLLEEIIKVALNAAECERADIAALLRATADRIAPMSYVPQISVSSARTMNSTAAQVAAGTVP